MQASTNANKNPSVEPEAERELVITRDIDAPARLLFEAYSKPEHLLKWFGPKPWPLTKCEIDFRPGGAIHMQMTGPGGEKGPPFGGTYLDIVPNRRIKYSNGFDDAAEKMTVTVSFEELAPNRTRLTVHTLFDTIEMKRTHTSMGYADGTNIGIDQLVAHLRDLA